MIIFFIYENSTPKVSGKIKKIYNSIEHGDFEAFKTIYETEFSSIKELENSNYYVNLVIRSNNIINDFIKNNKFITMIILCQGQVNVIIYITDFKRLEILKYIIEKGYNINQQMSMTGDTALTRAVYMNNKILVNFLLNYDINLEIKTHVLFILYSLKNCEFTSNKKQLGFNALQTAIFRDKVELVDLLMKKGAQFSMNSIKSLSNFNN